MPGLRRLETSRFSHFAGFLFVLWGNSHFCRMQYSGGVAVKHPGKHPDFITRSEEPFNAEPPLGLLRESFTTPAGNFYVRNHGNIPEVDPHDYRLSVCGIVDRPLSLSLEEIRDDFPSETVVATLYCAGNRREGLMEVAPIPGETPWGAGAVGNARWTGVPLREVLSMAGMGDDTRHVAFSGLDDAGGTSFGGSIPVEKAMSREVILAYEMNGGPLSPEHGFPLRVVVPGYIGARSIKWLSEIELRATPSDNRYQAEEYRLFPPNASAEEAESTSSMMLGELPVNAVICTPEDGEILQTGPVSVRGYAITGGDHCIERVDVSANGGETWIQAELSGDGDHSGMWRFWETNLDLSPGTHRLAARAIDSAANTQPREPREVWNFKGYVNNSHYCITVRAR